MCPSSRSCSCSSYRGTSECTLVPVFGTGEHLDVPSFLFLVLGNICQNHPFGNHPKLSAPKSQRFLRFAIAMPIADPRNVARFPKQEKAMLHCDLRVRWKVASDLRFRAAISEPKTPSFCGIAGDLAPSTRKSLAIAIVRFWCAKTTLF